MPRRMSVPLGRLPRAAMELRLRTTQEIYWDRLAVAYAAATPVIDVHSLPLASPGWRRRVPPSPAARGPPSVVRLRSARRHSRTRDTRAASIRRPGLVTELVAAQDGAVAVFGPGEELQLTFSAYATASESRLDATIRARGAWLVQGHGSLHARWRHRGAAAGKTRARGRCASAPLHHAVRVGTMTAGRWREFPGVIQDPAEASLAIKIAMKPIALMRIPV